LFRSEVVIRDSIRALDERKIEESVYYDVITDFSDIGLKDHDITGKYTILFPLLALLVMLFVYVLSKVVKFVKVYEA
jgi:hypothetical protein